MVCLLCTVTQFASFFQFIVLVLFHREEISRNSCNDQSNDDNTNPDEIFLSPGVLSNKSCAMEMTTNTCEYTVVTSRRNDDRQKHTIKCDT